MRGLGALLVAMAIAACTSGGGSTAGHVVGLHDLVLVDDLPTNGLVASEALIPDGGTYPLGPDPVTQGVPGRYLFLTSTDSDELKVLNLFRPGYVGRAFEQAPNPLESLGISVLDRPSVLANDEGLSPEGRRVTGPFVYAVRPGGAELSVVDATPSGFIQVTAAPLATPAPVTAIVGWMGSGLTAIPVTTAVYYATWDGELASLYVLTLPTDRARRVEVKSAQPRHLLDFGGEPVVALQVLPPIASRTLDGAPFCAGPGACLAVATRAAQGSSGRALLLDLETLRAAPLAFPGPVRDFSATGAGAYVYGTLDEEFCPAAPCGGVIAVETLAGTSAEGFPVRRDFTGQTMAPIRFNGALVRGMSMASNVHTSVLALIQLQEVLDGGTVSIQTAAQGYGEVGVVSTSAGWIYPVNTFSGVGVDFDGRRTALVSGFLRVPLPGPDGGPTLFLDDGGYNFEDFPAAITPADLPPTPDGTATLPYRSYTVAPDGGRLGDAPTSITIADGYLVSQELTVVREGAIAGLTLLETSAADDGGVSFPVGLEARVIPGDRIDFGNLETAADLSVQLVQCAHATIETVTAGHATYGPLVPMACNRTLFTISAGPGPAPLVVTSSVEGHLGRIPEGGTLTYRRRFLARPAYWDEPRLQPDGSVVPGQTPPRPALALSMGTMPPERLSRWTYNIQGNLELYRIAFDANSVGCSPYLPGRLKLAPTPKFLADDATDYAWSLLTLYPGGNGVMFAPLLSVYDPLVGQNVGAADGAICYR